MSSVVHVKSRFSENGVTLQIEQNSASRVFVFSLWYKVELGVNTAFMICILVAMLMLSSIPSQQHTCLQRYIVYSALHG